MKISSSLDNFPLNFCCSLLPGFEDENFAEVSASVSETDTHVNIKGMQYSFFTQHLNGSASFPSDYTVYFDQFTFKIQRQRFPPEALQVRIADYNVNKYIILFSCAKERRFNTPIGTEIVNYVWILTRERKPKPALIKLALSVATRYASTSEHFIYTNRRSCWHHHRSSVSSHEMQF